MNTQWLAFLNQAGAPLAAGGASRSTPAATESRAALAENTCCDLSQRGLIVARGPETEAFLQGQLTCDLRQLTPDRSLTGAYCTPKGRALACFRLFRREDGYYLELPHALLEPTLARLRRYVLRAKTVLEDESAALARMGVAGPEAESLLAESGLGAARDLRAGEVLHAEGITALRLPGPVTRFELHGPAPELSAVWNRLAARATPVGPEAWRLLAILAGAPEVYPETADAFIPQMLNLDLVDGIGFQKGCYTGQEIVARTHYLGKLKRRMFLARVDSPKPLHPGDPLFSPQADASQSAGQLADAAAHPDGGYAVLAVALIEHARRGVLQLGDVEGPTLRLESLPYPLEASG
ncbi:MAG: folate-binding protein [Candidatus Competibacter sp.]